MSYELIAIFMFMSMMLMLLTGQRVFAEYDYELYQELALEGMGMTQARKRANEF